MNSLKNPLLRQLSCGAHISAWDGTSLPPSLCPECSKPLKGVFDYNSFDPDILVTRAEVPEGQLGSCHDWSEITSYVTENKLCLPSWPKLVQADGIAHQLGKKKGTVQLLLATEPNFKVYGVLNALNLSFAFGAKAAATASTGSLGTVVARLCYEYGIPCLILLPDDTEPIRWKVPLSWGANVALVPGGYDEANKLCNQYGERHPEIARPNTAQRGAYLQGHSQVMLSAWAQYFSQGLRNPDKVFIPVGSGGLLNASVGIYETLQGWSLASKKPVQFYGVQPHGFPVQKACLSGNADDLFVDPIKTDVPALAIFEVPQGIEAIQAAKGTGGSIFGVDEKNALRYMKILHSEGIDCDITGGLTLAGAAERNESPDENLLIFLTSHQWPTRASAPRGKRLIKLSKPSLPELRKELGEWY